MNDTGMNVAERPTTLVLQQQQLLEGLRPAQMFPKGTPELPKPEGMARIVTSRGVFHFNPEMIRASDIVKLSNAGRENEILELGPFNKEDVAQMVARGEKPLAVTERRDGVEVKSAVGTESTADQQLASLDRTKLPGSEVVVEPVEDVIEGRGFADGGAAFGTLSPGEEGERAPNFLDKLFSHVLGSAATLPRRAIENSQYSLDSGNYDPAVPVEAALLPMGTGAIAGVPMRAGEAVLGAGPVRRATSELPMDEASRMARATAQGYEGPWYHGGERMDRLTETGKIDPRRATSGPMPFFTDDPAIASNYAKGKPDTSMADIEHVSDFFTVSPKDIGISGRAPMRVEQSWHFLPPENKAEILEKAKRVGYEKPSEASGPLTLHPPGTDASISGSQFDRYLKEERGNPLAALRKLWVESGELYGNEAAELANIYRLAGYKAPISEARAPWTEAKGVLPAQLRMVNPLQTDNVQTINEKILPALEQAFKGDRTRLKEYGADQWAKDTRYTPRQWIEQAKQDYAKGDNSFVWTSIPDKVTAELRRLGYDGIIDTGGKMGGQGHRVAVPFGPEQVRSQFAKFDPKKLGENGLLLSAAGAAPFLVPEERGYAMGGRVGFADGGAAELPDAPWATPATSELPDAPWGAGAPEPKPEPTSAWSAAAHGAGQGVSFNFSDEMLGVRAAGPDVIPEFIGPIPARTIAGAARLAANAVTGKDPEAVAAYEKARDEERKAIEAARRDHPYITMASEIAGGLATPIGVGAAAPTLAARMGRAALTGSGVGAMYGAGSGETMSERAANAGTGALVGGATGAVAPPLIEGVIQGVSRAVRPIANTIRGVVNPEAEAGRRVVNALERDFHNQGATFTPEEAAVARAANSPTAIIDAGGETTRALGRSAANTSPEARTALTGLVQDRFGTQNQRTSDFVQRLTGATGDNPATQEALQVAARQANRPAYAQAYRDGPVVWSGEIEQLAQAPAVQDAIRQATRSGANRAAADGFPPVRNPFEFDDAGHMTLRTNPDGSQAMPSLQFWDHVKRNLDDQHTSLQRSGENSAARDINDLRRQLLEQLDVSVPSYASARAGAARAFGAQDALEAGANFITSRMENAEARRAVARMTAPERQLFQQGYASALINKVREAGDRRTVLNQIAKSPAERERLEIALGPQRARELEVFLRVEGIMDRARAAVTGNSTTARQLAELGLAGGAYGIAGYGDLTDPRAVATGVLVLGLTRGRHRIDERVAQRVGEMLASNNPNVLQRGLRQVARAGRIFDGLRSMDGFSKIGGQQAPHPKLSQGPVPASAEDEKEKPPRKGQEKPTENQPD